MGLKPGAIDHRVAVGRLHRVHGGVYAVGHARMTLHGRWMAAVLASGEAALLSHLSAGALWQLVGADRTRTDVTTPCRNGRSRPGIQLHRVRGLHPDERATVDGIPLTSVARTLLDLAEVVDEARLRRAFEAAEQLRLFDLSAIRAARERNPGRHGLRAINALLPSLIPAPETRSELERLFVEVCREARLPAPVVNASVAGFEVDAVWPVQQLVVELDGYAFHGTRAAFERDRVRDAALQLAGYRVLRVTHRRLTDKPGVVAGTIRRLLG